MTAAVPKDAIGEELPAEGVGSIKSSVWKATLGGFTQTERTQSLAFPPGTKITIHNLSSSITHTLNVVKVITGPPAVFPPKTEPFDTGKRRRETRSRICERPD
jgi:hypothetical protein